MFMPSQLCVLVVAFRVFVDAATTMGVQPHGGAHHHRSSVHSSLAGSPKGAPSKRAPKAKVPAQTASFTSSGDHKDVDSQVEAFEGVGKEIKAFQGHVQKLRSENDEALRKMKITLQEKLQEKRSTSDALAESIKKLAIEIHSLKEANDLLVTKADRIKTDNKILLRDWHEMQANFTNALEMADTTMAKFEKDMADPMLDILDTLATEKRKLEAELNHHDALRSIGKLGASMSLLSHEVDPKIHLASLDGSLAKIEHSHKQMTASIQADYEKLFKVADDEQQELATRHHKLAEQRDALLALRTRLTIAVEHLQKIRKGLLTNTLMMRQYSKNMGAAQVAKMSWTSEQPKAAPTATKKAHHKH